MNMKKILLLAVMALVMTSCMSTRDAFYRTVRYVNRTEEAVNGWTDCYNYFSSLNPNKVSKNGTEYRYKDRGSNTVLYLRWYDTKMYRYGDFIIIYNTKGNYIVDKIPTVDWGGKTYTVRAYSPYDGVLTTLKVKVETSPNSAHIVVSYAGAPQEHYNL